jgi:hypothetical protein
VLVSNLQEAEAVRRRQARDRARAIVADEISGLVETINALLEFALAAIEVLDNLDEGKLTAALIESRRKIAPLLDAAASEPEDVV